MQAFRYVQASKFASYSPQGSRDFYVRAYCALLPPHAPDLLSVRIQVIDEKGLPPFQICSLVGCSTLSFPGRVEDWRGAPQVQPICFSPFPLGVPHELNRKPVSSPRLIERSVRISRTALPHLLHPKAYGPILPGRLSACRIAPDSRRTASECHTATANSIAPSRSPFASEHAPDGA